MTTPFRPTINRNQNRWGLFNSINGKMLMYSYFRNTLESQQRSWENLGIGTLILSEIVIGETMAEYRIRRAKYTHSATPVKSAT